MSAEWSEQAAPQGVDAIPGKTLAAQREAMGWTVEQVADQLKLAVRQVVALEAGDYAALPGPAVVRGFIRAYAKVVKLDAAPLVALIPLETPAASDATLTTVKRDKPASFSEVRFPTNGKRNTLPLGWIALAGVVVAGAAAAWQFDLIPAALLHPGAAPTAASAPASAAAPAATKPADAPLDTTLVKSGQELAPVPSTSVPLISVPPQNPNAASPAIDAPATQLAPAAAAPAAAGARQLVLNVTGDSWIEVRPAKGKPLLARMVRAGQSETLNLDQPVTLIVGKPSAVQATLGGAAVELPPIAGSTISRVSLK